jgi:RNA polymerase-binding protein DksA
MLSRHEIAMYKDRLQQLLARADANRVDLREEALFGTGGEASGGISNVPIHPADLGTRESAEQVSLQLLENEEHLLEEIDRALDRIDEGTFGRCEACGQRIDKQRLEVLPFARRCIRCARAQQ